jgi:radical SAM protein with 4Fe4S-binding SPASM domain
MVVNTLNFDDIYQTAVFAHQLGAESFAATRMALTSSNRSADLLRLTREQVQMSLEVLEQVREHIGITVESLACYPLCLLSDLERFRHIMRRRCGAGKTTCTISARGNGRPCSFSDMTYGNILTESLPTIWERMSDWRQSRYVYQGCQQCQLLSLCGGGCRMEAKYSGDICGPDPYMTSPEDVEHIPQKRPVALVPVDQSLFLQTSLTFREEPFGGIVYNKRLGIVPVDHEHFRVLRLIMPQNSFTTAEIAERGGGTLEHLQKFFSLFVAQGFLTTCERG